jgi:inorganic pyrophosphatase
MNPWHDVSPGDRAPDIVDCIIEVPRGNRNKYELDKKSGMLRLDRVLSSAVFYPANYGFIPRTYCDDSDPLDILVLGQEPVVPMCILTARPIGVMQMVDQNEQDDKIIAIHEHDPAFRHFRDISHLPEHTLEELQRFFEDYKLLERKTVRIERFRGRVDALAIIQEAIQLYRATFTDEAAVTPAPAPREEAPHHHGPSRSVLINAAWRQAAHLSEMEKPSANKAETGDSRRGAPCDETAENATRSTPASDSASPFVIDEQTLQAFAPRPPETPNAQTPDAQTPDAQTPNAEDAGG